MRREIGLPESFALLASGMGESRAGGERAGVLTLGPELWRGALPWGEASDAR